MADRLTLTAPLTGLMVSIDTVPDPVFARKLVGDGFSIDPLSNDLLAPIAGEVADLQPSGHAVTIRSDEGLEVLLHIGLDTVKMDGAGFTPHVSVGSRVDVGDTLVSFDLDLVAREAKSLLTQVVVTNSELITDLETATGMVTAGSDVAAYVQLAEETAADGAAAPKAKGKPITSGALVVMNPTGLHARPAATLVSHAKGYDADIQLRRGDDVANAKSIMAIMGLAVARGDKVTVVARGVDADAAVAELSQAIKSGLGEDISGFHGSADTTAIPAVAQAVQGAPESESAQQTLSRDHAAAEAAAAAAADQAAPRSGDPNLLLGVSASPGLAIGTVLQWRHDDIDVDEYAQDHHKERRKLTSAIDAALLDLSALQRRLEQEADADKAAIFGAHQEILGDPDLLDLAVSAIDKGKSAPFAWRGAFTTYAERLAALPNEVLAGRAADVRDVGHRVLEELTGQRRERPDLPEGTILVAEELTPSDTAGLDRTKVVGFATTGGGASSHVAIIARSLDLPAVAGIEGRALAIEDGTRVILDGSKGSLRVGADDAEIADIEARQERLAAQRAEHDAHKHEPAVTPDGHRVEVVANIGSADDAAAGREMGGEGVGLLRSEFAFMGRRSAPSEQEQADAYAACARALAPGQRLVVRTLDVGGDKPLPYLPIPHEENPFLGMRGVRIGLESPEVLRAQCRAILAAADAGAAVHVMFPMIATMADWRRAKAIWDEERDRSGVTTPVPVGIMMEVPSVAVLARQFAAEDGCDFFSVGTNDLTSYVLAMDRGHPKLASQVDPCNPAVLALIGSAAQALHEHGKWLSVCGGIASDPQAVPILVGLGVDELSCSVPAIPSVKAAVRAYTLAQCQDLAAQAVAAATPEDVRALVPDLDA